MPNHCAVVGCKSEYNPFNGAISFHRVTRNKKYLPLWEQVVKLKENSVHAKICSLHFKAKDFIEGRYKRVLKPTAVPSLNVQEKNNYTDDEDDNENLSILKKLLTSSKSASGDDNIETTGQVDDYVHDTNVSQNFEMVVPCCNFTQSSNLHNGKQTSNIGIQTKMKTDKEITLQARVKLLQLRLRRRDAKISYMQTVLNMIKKHTKGTDMEYKLCCELQNISEFPEPVKSNLKQRNGTLNVGRSETVESPVSENENGETSGDEAGSFTEVVYSPNLKTNGF